MIAGLLECGAHLLHAGLMLAGYGWQRFLTFGGPIPN